MKNPLNKKADITREFEEALTNGFPKEEYVLRLYVTGMTFRSVEAVSSIKAFCERHLHDGMPPA